MEIDGATRKNLELLESLTGDKGATLLSVMDRTVTAVAAACLPGAWPVRWSICRKSTSVWMSLSSL